MKLMYKCRLCNEVFTECEVERDSIKIVFNYLSMFDYAPSQISHGNVITKTTIHFCELQVHKQPSMIGFADLIGAQE